MGSIGSQVATGAPLNPRRDTIIYFLLWEGDGILKKINSIEISWTSFTFFLLSSQAQTMLIESINSLILIIVSIPSSIKSSGITIPPAI